MNAEKTGALIKQLRTSKNLTQAQLAELVNVSDKAVSKWERGDGCPDITIMPKLAEVLGVEMESLVAGSIPKSQDVSGLTIKDYNFRQPDVYPRHMQKDILFMGEEIRKKINKAFTATLNDRCEFSLLGVDQMVNIEFLRSIPKSCFFYDFDFQNNGFCVELDPELGKMLLKQDAEKYPVITEFDLEVLKDWYLKDFAKALSEEIAANTDGSIDADRFSLSRVHANENANNSNQEEWHMMLLLIFTCKVNGKDSYMNLQLSAGLLEDMSMAGFFSEGYSSRLKFQVLSNVKDRQAPDNVFVEFGRFRPENVNLEHGNILIMDKKESEGLNVVAGNKVIHSGKAIVAGEHLGVEVLESHQLSDIVYDEDDFLAVRLGAASLSEEEISSLHQGSYIILDQIAGEPLLITRGEKVVATGDIVIVDSNFGIRVLEVK